MRETWERAAGAWGRRAERIREWGMPVSLAMVEALDLRPGESLLELAAGPGDTGFMAAPRIAAPGGVAAAGASPAGVAPGTLLCSDGAEAMLALARERAAHAGVTNVEFRQMELEWIDLAAAEVDAALCRWGIMLVVDPSAAAREIRRVLRPGGRAALAVWDLPAGNAWATIPSAAMVELGHVQASDPDAPGMFALAAPGRLEALLEDAGFTDVEISTVQLWRRYRSAQEYVEEMIDVSPTFGAAWSGLDGAERAEVSRLIADATVPHAAADGSLALPGSSLVATAHA